MTAPLTAPADRYLKHLVNYDLEGLLAPVSPDHPAGPSLRRSPVYAAIREARREDDASLPQGAWQFELKRADWETVATLAASALAKQSKDLQLAVWLLEAGVNLHGFHALAPGFVLLEQLSERYWDTVWPQVEEGDLEYRGNVFRWLDEKLLPLLRRVPLTVSGREQEMCWADWEMANRGANRRADRGATRGSATPDGSGEFLAALYATPSEDCELAHASLATALTALESLQACLDRYFGADGPGFSALHALLGEILGLYRSELGKRGHTAPEPAPVDEYGAAAAGSPEPGSEAIHSREEAYANLARAAEFLLRLEPHSPVPYLVRRAIDWGHLNTVELYQELFVRMNGQISIFDLLGLKEEERA